MQSNDDVIGIQDWSAGESGRRSQREVAGESSYDEEPRSALPGVTFHRTSGQFHLVDLMSITKSRYKGLAHVHGSSRVLSLNTRPLLREWN